MERKCTSCSTSSKVLGEWVEAVDGARVCKRLGTDFEW